MSSIILTGFDLTYRCTGKEMSYQHTHWRDVEVVCTYYRLSLVGPEGKIFGSRSTYGSRLARFVCNDLTPNILPSDPIKLSH